MLFETIQPRHLMENDRFYPSNRFSKSQPKLNHITKSQQELEIQQMMFSLKVWILRKWLRLFWLANNSILYLVARPKKLPVVPVSYGEKFRVGRSEYKLFLNNFFHDLSGFVSKWFNTRHFGTPWSARNHPEKIRLRGQSLQKIIRSAEKNSRSRGTGTTGIFFGPTAPLVT